MGRHGYFLIIDADHFKRVNDTLGHPSGDLCLQAIADRILSVLRKDDLIGRIGGEEFGVLLFDRTMEEIQRFSGRLCFPIKVSVPGHRELLRLTVSAGATEINPNDTLSKLTARADEALIAAKKNGRERMVLWRNRLEQREVA
jgi:diguanylate cyclase (GGDEF)-like protein